MVMEGVDSNSKYTQLKSVDFVRVLLASWKPAGM